MWQATDANWLWIGIGLLICGAILLFVARSRRPPADARRISASHGGVAVGGDNKGTISTRTSDSARNPLELAALAITALGIVIALLAWLYPMTR